MAYVAPETSGVPVRIAVVVPTDFAYAREIVRGLLAAPQPVGAAEFCRFPDVPGFLEALAQWQPHGAVYFYPQVVSWIGAMQALKLPVVNVGNEMPEGSLPRVGVDDRAIGALAAEYFLERGFRRLGYAHIPGWRFSQLRWEGFSARAREAGCSCQDYISPQFWERFHTALWTTFDEGVAEWLRQMPKPLGVFGANDNVAAHVVSVCRRKGLAVPEEVAVLGVDDDELECLESHPALSSIQLPTRRIGEAAYAMLRGLVVGRPVQQDPVLLPPTRVVTRASTETLALEDVDVAAAVRLIRGRAAEGVTVKEVVGGVEMSRRSLELRFRRALGRTPMEEIRRARVEEAKEQLLETHLKVAEVAHRCGFRNLGTFGRAFRAQTGLSAGAYRRAFGGRRNQPIAPEDPQR